MKDADKSVILRPKAEESKRCHPEERKRRRISMSDSSAPPQNDRQRAQDDKVSLTHFAFKTSWGIALVLALSFAAKLLARLILSRNIDFWLTGYGFYYEMAKHLVHEGKFYFSGSHGLYAVDQLYAVRTPLYPFFVALVGQFTNFSAPAFIVMQSLISTLTVLVTYRVSLKFSNNHAALFAAIFCAFYPYSFLHDTQLQENCLYNFASLLSLWYLIDALERKKFHLFLLAGFLLGITTLIRGSHLVHSFFLILWVLFAFRKQIKKALLFTTAIGIGLSLCLSPWFLRNQKVVGSFSLSTMTGGSLSAGNNELTFLDYPYKGSIDRSIYLHYQKLAQEGRACHQTAPKTEVAQEKCHRKLAYDYIMNHKLQFIVRGFYKAAVNFLGVLSPLQNPVKNITYFLSYWLLTLLAAVGIPKLWKTIFFQSFLVLSFSQAVISFVFWATTSHRSFLDPMLAILAGVGLARVRSLIPRPATS